MLQCGAGPVGGRGEEGRVNKVCPWCGHKADGYYDWWAGKDIATCGNYKCPMKLINIDARIWNSPRYDDWATVLSGKVPREMSLITLRLQQAVTGTIEYRMVQVLSAPKNIQNLAQYPGQTVTHWRYVTPPREDEK